MTIQLTESQIEKWRNHADEASSDSEWVSRNTVRNQERIIVQKEILDLFQKFQTDEIPLETLKETFDQKTRTDWDVFGFKGMSGAMFLNMLVKHIPDQVRLIAELKHVFELAADELDGRNKLEGFSAYLEDVITSGRVTRRAIQPARVPFLVSGIWHLKDNETWPIFYISGRRVLTREGLYEPKNDPVEDYFIFRSIFLQLSTQLQLSSWDLEQVLARMDEQHQKNSKKFKGQSAAPAILPVMADEQTLEDESDTDVNHTHIQGLLAKIGRKLDCRIWIAANDKRKIWNGQTLGNLSIDQLPQLGLDPESQKIISLIDVLWIKGYNQVVAAFEIEHTTSVYSGLLRMSDLVVSSPNLNFQLYIVTPDERLPKVRQQLSRPTFQMLDLHKMCGFFSFETLHREAESILRWATDTVVIDQLAEKVEDISLGY